MQPNNPCCMHLAWANAAWLPGAGLAGLGRVPNTPLGARAQAWSGATCTLRHNLQAGLICTRHIYKPYIYIGRGARNILPLRLGVTKAEQHICPNVISQSAGLPLKRDICSSRIFATLKRDLSICNSHIYYS